MVFVLSIKASFSISKPFITDGCTFFIDGIPNTTTQWKTCCIKHDFRYWVGGTSKIMDYSDQELSRCIRTKTNSVISSIVYFGVRLGHYSPIKNKYKWNWSRANPSSNITSSELIKIKNNFEKYVSDDPQSLKDFLKIYLMNN